MQKSLLFTAAGITALSALAGCNGGNSKADAALEHLRQRKDPGFFRIVNLTKYTYELREGNRQMTNSVEPGGVSKMLTIGEGARTVTLLGEEKPRDVKVTITTQVGTTMVLKADGTYFVVNGEPRRPVDGQNVFVASVDMEGKPVTGTSFPVNGLLGKKELPADKPLVTLGLGDWSTTGSIYSQQTTRKIEDKFSYTFLFIKDSSGKFRPFFMLNTPNEKPIAAGSS